MNKRPELHAVILRFVVVGMSSAALYFVAVWFLLNYTSIPMFWSSASSYSLLVGLAYLAQRNWTFRSNAPHRQSLTRYLCVQFACIALTAILSHSLVQAVSLSSFVAALASTAIASVLTFVLSSVWVFAEPPSDEDTA